MDKHRWKIDITEYYNPPYDYSLYQERVHKSLFRRDSYWRLVRSFKTHEEAREYYETVKDLPEYLG